MWEYDSCNGILLESGGSSVYLLTDIFLVWKMRAFSISYSTYEIENNHILDDSARFPELYKIIIYILFFSGRIYMSAYSLMKYEIVRFWEKYTIGCWFLLTLCSVYENLSFIFFNIRLNAWAVMIDKVFLVHWKTADSSNLYTQTKQISCINVPHSRME